VFLQDVCINSLKLLNSQKVWYEYVWANSIVEIINSRLLQAVNNGEIITKELLKLDCLQIDNTHGRLQSPKFDINSKFVNNNHGIICGNDGQVVTKLLDNHHGVISTANIKPENLTLELLKVI